MIGPYREVGSRLAGFFYTLPSRTHLHEPRHTRKSPEDRRDGYRAHLVACPETGIITAEQLTG